MPPSYSIPIYAILCMETDFELHCLRGMCIVAGMVSAIRGGDKADFNWETPEPGVLLVKVKG